MHGRLQRVLRERGRVLRIGRSRDRSRALFRSFEDWAEGEIPIRAFLDSPRRQGCAPAADRRHPSHRTSAGKMTGAHRMKRVQLNGTDIEYEVRGSGAPVVFIHGSILSDGFVPVIEQTGIAENFQIVHYRRRGYASSSRAVAGMTVQGWARDCIALLNHLGIAAAHVAGHSFGASIALQMAIDAPGRVRKLALLEPPLLSLVPSGWQFTDGMAYVRKIYDSGDKTAATDMVLAGAYGQDYRRFTDVALPAGAFDRAVSDIDTYFQVELGAMQHWNISTEGLKDIRRPVLSMRGSDTLPVFFEGADLLQQWIPEIDTVSIPGASHDLPGRNPAAVATGLVEFFTNKNDLDVSDVE